MTSYQYRKSHCGDKTVLRPSCLHSGISYTGKMTSLYWIRALECFLRRIIWDVSVLTRSKCGTLYMLMCIMNKTWGIKLAEVVWWYLIYIAQHVADYFMLIYCWNRGHVTMATCQEYKAGTLSFSLVTAVLLKIGWPWNSSAGTQFWNKLLWPGNGDRGPEE